MKINYFDKSVSSVEICCDNLWVWINEGLLLIEVRPNQEECRAVLRVTEQGESVNFCPFCGSEIIFNHQ